AQDVRAIVQEIPIPEEVEHRKVIEAHGHGNPEDHAIEVASPVVSYTEISGFQKLKSDFGGIETTPGNLKN
ncbi:MAG: hypothetical protein M3Q07_17345, partial [Pseudobdellovibrionaceae bacterium]|nr:hypothetical protein [Pseudobdellovibrionaceae bacterium]